MNKDQIIVILSIMLVYTLTCNIYTELKAGNDTRYAHEGPSRDWVISNIFGMIVFVAIGLPIASAADFFHWIKSGEARKAAVNLYYNVFPQGFWARQKFLIKTRLGMK